MLCCLKAWVEHNTNLRKGFFQGIQPVGRSDSL